MAWYVVQTKEGFEDFQSPHTCFEIKTCIEHWKTNHTIIEELSARNYLNCQLISCSEEQMQVLTDEEGPYRRRRLPGMGPYDCLSISPEAFDNLITLLHVNESYQVIRCVAKKSDETKPGEVMRGLLRGLKGQVVTDRANQRKFTPTQTLPGLDVLVLIPAAELKPLTKVEYESQRLKIDTSAKWYMVLCKNDRTLQQAFRLPPRMRTQEGIYTEESNLLEFKYGMPYPQGISSRRYYYHVGKPFPKHYYFVFTTLSDVQSCRVRNPYARISVVWNRGYRPVALNERDFDQLIDGVEGREKKLSAAMRRFVDSLKRGDHLNVFLTNLQEVPIPARVDRVKKDKVVVTDEQGRHYTVPKSQIKPPSVEKK